MNDEREQKPPAEERSTLADRLKALLGRAIRSEVKPTIESDASGTRWFGIAWKKRF